MRGERNRKSLNGAVVGCDCDRVWGNIWERGEGYLKINVNSKKINKSKDAAARCLLGQYQQIS